MLLNPNSYTLLVPSGYAKNIALGLSVLEALNVYHKEYGNWTREDKAMFLSHAFVESKYLTDLEEDLHYRPETLIKTFSFYKKNPQLAYKEYKKPAVVFSRVYGGRMGNAPYPSQEGFRLIGRGVFQTTGKYNYSKLSQSLFSDDRLLRQPELLFLPEWAAKSALHYWKSKGMAGITNVTASTKILNGGTHGLDKRKLNYEKLLTLVP
jgi:putative chitinase